MLPVLHRFIICEGFARLLSNILSVNRRFIVAPEVLLMWPVIALVYDVEQMIAERTALPEEKLIIS